MLTAEDLAAIRAFIREEIRASERPGVAPDPTVDEMKAQIAGLVAEIKSWDSRSDRRLERVAEQLAVIQDGLTALNRWADKLDRESLARTSQFYELQSTIRMLSARVEQIEREWHPGSQQ